MKERLVGHRFHKGIEVLRPFGDVPVGIAQRRVLEI